LITVVVIRREFFVPGDPNAPRELRNWRELGSAGLVIANPEGRRQMVVFSDFECPYCRNLAPKIDSLLIAYPGDLRVVFRNYPLGQIHPHAYELALGGVCAAAFDRFKQYHDLAFALHDSLDTIGTVEIARRSGIADTGAFNACLAASSTRESIEQDVRQGDDLGVNATPTLVLGNLRVVGALPVDSLMSLLNSAPLLP